MDSERFNDYNTYQIVKMTRVLLRDYERGMDASLLDQVKMNMSVIEKRTEEQANRLIRQIDISELFD